MSQSLTTTQRDTALAHHHAAQFDDPAKIALIKDTVAVGASDLELALFLEVCKATGLNPFQKQIYAIKRSGRMTIQTGIDGYRLIASRTGVHAGTEDAEFETAPDGRPVLARVTVLRFVQGTLARFTATARWSEYAQMTSSGAPTEMWRKMPHTMLAKCAEALALRKAFPAELSGVYTKEEMMQADAEIITPTPPLAQIAEPQEVQDAHEVELLGLTASGFAQAVRDYMTAALSGQCFSADEVATAVTRAESVAPPARHGFWAKLETIRDQRADALEYAAHTAKTEVRA
jgi:phage recombination protein Bet